MKKLNKIEIGVFVSYNQNILIMKKQLLTIGSAILLGATATSLKAQTASLQVIHNCADAAATTVDIYAGTALLIDNLQWRNLLIVIILSHVSNHCGKQSIVLIHT